MPNDAVHFSHLSYVRSFPERVLLMENGSCKTVEPVSNRDFRLEMAIGQTFDNVSISFDGSCSIVWVMESLVATPLDSSSIVQRDSPSALSSGLD